MREYLRYRSEKFPQNSPASPDALALLWLNLYLLSNTVILINTVQSMLKMSVIEKCVGGVPLVCSKHALGTPKFVNHLQIFVLMTAETQHSRPTHMPLLAMPLCGKATII
ncbi:hypothetical protein PROFUN_16376 [Planoprotostelium fungivorum]|uniref:Uncharacterized protein n=1 Tax=Planoprotostelium fungivorum TaxID=1890364 RepID=A0A2P6MQR7_9EUKA|nr:hypothetical protein PROFUN_16376 [Planoprotostelium fungivorum]